MNRRRGVIAFGLVLGALLAAPGARAAEPTAEELATGRQLFTEALDDEDHQRFAAALEKYQRVLEIRETAPVHYRIGVTLEGLGRTRDAIGAYEAVLRTGTAPADAEVMRAAKARIEALEPKVAHLAVRLPPNAPADAEVRVDDVPVANDRLDDVRLDPGTHVVTVKTSDGRTSRAEATIPEGGRVELPVALEGPPAEAPRAEPKAAPLRTIGIATGIGGVVLMGVGAVFLALRSSAISELEESCPNGNCPASREQELRDTRDGALRDGPIGGALIGVGALAAGAGVVLFTLGDRQDAKASARLVPGARTSGGVTLDLIGSF